MSSNKNTHTSATDTYNQWLLSSTGEKSVDFQKSAQITWWSILQGLSIVALAEKSTVITSEINQQGHWYLLLYAITSLMIIVIGWVQMAWAILIYRWPIKLLHTTLVSLLGLSTYLVCFYVHEPVNWMISMIFLLLSAIMIYIYNIKYRTMINLPLKITWITIGAYAVFVLITILASYHLYATSDGVTFTVWGFVYVIFVSLAWGLQAYNMNEEQQIRQVSS